MNTIGDMQNEKYFYDYYNEFVYNHDYEKIVGVFIIYFLKFL